VHYYSQSLLLSDYCTQLYKTQRLKSMLYKSLKDKIKNHSDMFRILCDPSSRSTELCLTEITRIGSQVFCRVLGQCLAA